MDSFTYARICSVFLDFVVATVVVVVLQINLTTFTRFTMGHGGALVEVEGVKPLNSFGLFTSGGQINSLK